MVPESVVLGRVEHLQQGRGGVTAVVTAQLVDLVQQHDRVHRPGLAHSSHDTARKGADIGAAVAADLGLVTHPAERHADELASEGPRYGLAERGLADPGRPNEREHGTGAASTHDLKATGLTAAADGEVLHHPVLHVLEAFVVGIQHLAGGDDVVAVIGADVPGQLEHRVQPGADPAGFGTLVAGTFEPSDLAQSRFEDLVGKLGRLHAGAVVVGAVGLTLAELLSDRGKLLAQQELPLALLHALVHVAADALGDIELGEVGAAPLDQFGEALADVHGLEQPELLLDGQVWGVAGHVGQLVGLGDALHGVDDLPGAPLLKDRDDDVLVLTCQLVHFLAAFDRLDDLGLDPKRRSRPGDTRADARRETARSTAAGSPPGSLPSCSIVATTPTSAYLPSRRGTTRTWFSPPALAASTAACRSASSSVTGTTMCGSTTTSASGRTGSC